jgi:hypothetical protein
MPDNGKVERPYRYVRQDIGRRNADADVLAASAAFERLRPWCDSYRLCQERPLSVQAKRDNRCGNRKYGYQKVAHGPSASHKMGS